VKVCADGKEYLSGRYPVSFDMVFDLISKGLGLLISLFNIYIIISEIIHKQEKIRISVLLKYKPRKMNKR